MINKKPVRRSQLISPWGVGQMINFPGDESLMVAGLDMWEERFRSLTQIDEFKIREPRLAKRLRVKDFRLPPDFREPGQGVNNPGITLPFITFPRWHYCPRCGKMKKNNIYNPRPVCNGFNFGKGQNCIGVTARKRFKMIPVRFIAICPKHGHIQDFPFVEWVHKGGKCSNSQDPQLRLRAGRSTASLSGIEISCANCGAVRTLAGAFNENSLSKIGYTCEGERPWLGELSEFENTIHCGEVLRVIQKGASNVYFPNVRSSLYLPEWESSVEREIIELLERKWDILTSGLEKGKLQRLRFEIYAEERFGAENAKEYADIMYDLAEEKMKKKSAEEQDTTEEKYRKMEYDSILSEKGGDNQDFFVTKEKIMSYDKDTGKYIRNAFSCIALLHKLKETRAFVGFARWLPEDNKSLDDKKNSIRLGKSINWLPAMVVKGEGVFFEFNHNKLKNWASNEKVVNRARQINRSYNQTKTDRGLEARIINARFILIHTFAHLVINQFSYECGYGSSALRERIYCNIENESELMNGVLIYTASGDSEGSLGGLVRQGKPGNLESIVFNAIENARWCSSDPICIESSGQGPNSCNLAACHNCTLMPETCCEEMNMLLDRGLVIGTLDEPEIGYFNYTL